MTGEDGYIKQLARSGDAREMMQTLGVLIIYMNENSNYRADPDLAQSMYTLNILNNLSAIYL